MMEQLLFFLYGAAVLLFGIFVSAAFAGVKSNKKNIAILVGIFVFSGLLQLAVYMLLGEEFIWKLYPLISHLPVLIALCTVFCKKPVAAAASLFTAYLCCQPSKWFGLLIYGITDSMVEQYITRILVLVLVAVIVFMFVSDYIAQIYDKNDRTVLLLGITPTVYYFFDYITVVYLNVFNWKNPVIVEFMPFFLCIIFMTFCLIYHREYEEKSDAERKEQIVKIMLSEQKKEYDAIKRSEHEIRLIRHDMRLVLNSISVCIDNGDLSAAKKLISAYSDNIESTVVKKYCSNNMLNYTLSSFADRCTENNTTFVCRVDVDDISCDEIMLSGIISNAMDNAINAQQAVPQKQRRIQLILKNHNGRLLLSVKNRLGNTPHFFDGVPVSDKKGHGYGTQSIIYLAEKMGGNCRFSIEDCSFILRVII